MLTVLPWNHYVLFNHFFSFLGKWIAGILSFIRTQFSMKWISLQSSWWDGLVIHVLSQFENFYFWAKHWAPSHSSPLEEFWTPKYHYYLTSRWFYNPLTFPSLIQLALDKFVSLSSSLRKSTFTCLEDPILLSWMASCWNWFRNYIGMHSECEIWEFSHCLTIWSLFSQNWHHLAPSTWNLWLK